jgi:FKBP-type peptidyl-prolyl cis-trans isomerase
MRRVVLLVALVLTLAACGGSDDASDNTSDTGPAPGPDGETTTTVRSGESPIEGIAMSGDLVETHYTGTLDDGSQFDSSVGRDPLSFTIDDGRMIKGFNDAVIGMAVGDTKTITLPPEEAYGPYLEDAPGRSWS